MTSTPSPFVTSGSRMGSPWAVRGLVLVVILGLLAVELGLRSYTTYGASVEREVDPVVGWRLRTTNLAYGESGITLRVNSQGFRDQEWPAAGFNQEPGLRIAVLGDSVTFGVGVEESERWTEVLEESLRGVVPEARVVVMNLGLPGYTFSQMARCYEHVARLYEPDLVLIALNDISARPAAVLQPADGSALAQAMRRTALYDFWQRSVLAGDHPPGRRYNKGERAERRRVKAIWEEPFAPAHELMWRRFIKGTAELAHQVSLDGSRLVLIPVPAFVHCRNPGGPRLGDRLAVWAPIQDLERIDSFGATRKVMDPILKRVQELGLDPDLIWSKSGAPEDYLDSPWARQSLFFLHDPVHLTPKGHALLAAEVFKGLREEGLLGELPASAGD